MFVMIGILIAVQGCAWKQPYTVNPDYSKKGTSYCHIAVNMKSGDVRAGQMLREMVLVNFISKATPKFRCKA